MSEETQEQVVDREPTEAELKAFVDAQVKYLKSQLPLLRLQSEFSRIKTQLDTDEVSRLQARNIMAQFKAEQEKASKDGDSKPSE